MGNKVKVMSVVFVCGLSVGLGELSHAQGANSGSTGGKRSYSVKTITEPFETSATIDSYLGLIETDATNYEVLGYSLEGRSEKLRLTLPLAGTNIEYHNRHKVWGVIEFENVTGVKDAKQWAVLSNMKQANVLRACLREMKPGEKISVHYGLTPESIRSYGDTVSIVSNIDLPDSCGAYRVAFK